MHQSETILIVEDDERLAILLKELIESSGYKTYVEPTGEGAIARLSKIRPQLIILDINLPGMDGFAVCRTVRPDFEGGILMLTARGEEIDELIGLEAGADDYLPKPVAPSRLLARIRAILRRIAKNKSEQILSVRSGGLRIDSRTREVTLNGSVIALSSSEFDLIWLLATNIGTPISRETLFRKLKGYDYDGLDRSIDLRISKLRQCLGDDPKKPKWIKTVRGSGYMLAQYS